MAHALGCGCSAEEAPGWAAIEEALRAAHTAEPTFYSSSADDEAIDAVACFGVDAPEPHFLLVSLGLSELYGKTFANPATSGHGFELTLRVARAAGAERPPGWAVVLLHTLATYVERSGRPLAIGDHLDAHGPLAPGSALTGVCIAADPLGSIRTPYGALQFRQVHGLTDDEIEAMADGDGREIVGRVEALGVTDAARPSLLADAATAAEIQRGITADGSSQHGSAVEDLGWREEGSTLVLRIGAAGVRALARGLCHRVPFGRDYQLHAPAGRLLLAPAAETGWTVHERELTLLLPADGARALGRALAPRRGRYTVDNRVAIEVVATTLTDDAGEIIRVIG